MVDTGTCSICVVYLQRPVCIPCGHLFCLECLHVYVKSQGARFEYFCPDCRQAFRLASINVNIGREAFLKLGAPAIRPVWIDFTPVVAQDELIKSLRLKITQLEASESEAKKAAERRQREHGRAKFRADRATAECKRLRSMLAIRLLEYALLLGLFAFVLVLALQVAYMMAPSLAERISPLLAYGWAAFESSYQRGRSQL